VGEDPDPAKIASFIAPQSESGWVGGTSEPKVISDGDWAAYFRLHLFKNCADISYFALRQWSSHEAAVEWEESVLAYCPKLPDCELLESLASTSEPDFHEDREKWISNIRKLQENDPWNPEFCDEIAENAGHSLDGVKAAWGEVREYRKRPLRQTLKGPGLTVAQRIESLKILIKMDPAAGLELGAVLVMEKRPEEAIQAYEEAYQKAGDRVAVSNRSWWMIHHYKSKGDGKALHQVFPGGLGEVMLADFPADKNPAGCRVMCSSSTLLAVGMRPGDVVVATDGKRVEDFG
jgi:tetratricopeptide (TPR) repeat protein